MLLVSILRCDSINAIPCKTSAEIDAFLDNNFLFTSFPDKLIDSSDYKNPIHT